ncbi:MAG: glycoside hydrolase family 32 protein [Lachnospiraceae bacterium]|nr:glycoside hydrolase family 32 protein [Lachnospiraceae bacterium]
MEALRHIEIAKTNHALSFHLMPPVGWLNDPNGLCECNGIFHIFFQYSPKNANGGDKYWGHYETKNFVDYKYTGPFMSPDNILDTNGVYSGSAFVEDKEIYIYYTGNVKEQGDYDYTYAGRLSNTILVRTKDGSWTDEKAAVLKNADYPSGLSCHIRDPKVFKEDDEYKMVLGARTANDVGCVLLYKSKDKINWKFERFIESKEPFGFMWECPDVIDLKGKRFLSISPQGVMEEEFRYQNVYQSGYYKLLDKSYDIDEEIVFSEWDMGFDFYAPQSFRDESGRYILIGWMGIPDADYTNEPTVNDGWQHALTMARELVLNSKGRISQRPIKEYEALVGQEIAFANDGGSFKKTAKMVADSINDQSFKLVIDKSLVLNYDSELKIVSLEFDQDKEMLEGAINGYGRRVRRAKISEINDFNIYLDNSAVEIYINDGEMVFSSRYYLDSSEHVVEAVGLDNLRLYEFAGFNISI